MTSYLNHVKKLSPIQPIRISLQIHAWMLLADSKKQSSLKLSLQCMPSAIGGYQVVNPNGQGIISLRMRPVNAVVLNFSIKRFNQEVQTIFDEPRPKKDNSESGRDKKCMPTSPLDGDRLLSISDGLATLYLRQTGKESPLYTIMGA